METPSCDNEVQPTEFDALSNETCRTLHPTRRDSRREPSQGSDAMVAFQLMTALPDGNRQYRIRMMTFRYFPDRLLCRQLPGRPADESRAGWPMKAGRRISTQAQPKAPELDSCQRVPAMYARHTLIEPLSRRISAPCRADARPRTHRRAANSRCSSPASPASPRRNRIWRPQRRS